MSDPGNPSESTPPRSSDIQDAQPQDLLLRSRTTSLVPYSIPVRKSPSSPTSAQEEKSKASEQWPELDTVFEGLRSRQVAPSMNERLDTVVSTFVTSHDNAIQSLEHIYREAKAVNNVEVVEQVLHLTTEFSKLSSGIDTLRTKSYRSAKLETILESVEPLEDDEVNDTYDFSPLENSMTSRSESVKTFDYVFEKLWDAVIRIYQRRPDHPMFGNPGPSLVRLPLGPLESGLFSSWHKKCDRLARRISRETGPRIVPYSCWMLRGERSTRIGEKNHTQKKTTVFVEMSVARFTAFLAHPSDENWRVFTGELRGELRSIDYPFCHTCHNGIGSMNRTRTAPACVNGLQHGFFSTPTINQNMKPCVLKCKAECPGHQSVAGLEKKCIYVDRRGDGRILPCLNANWKAKREECDCIPNCFDVQR